MINPNINDNSVAPTQGELLMVKSTCGHCSAGCFVQYEVQAQINCVTTSDTFLCEAGRLGFDYANTQNSDTAAFERAVNRLENAKAIRFSSMITNEETVILNTLKAKLGLKLFNEDARQMQRFMQAYSTVSGTMHHSATLASLRASDAIIVVGSRMVSDNPAVYNAMTRAVQENSAKLVYMHPLEDATLLESVSQFVKYEVGTEEGVLALLAQTLITTEVLTDDERAFLADLDEGYLSAETNVGDDELEELVEAFNSSTTKTLVIGSDVLGHERSENIARLVGMIEKNSDFSVLVVPKEVNTLGVSLIADLDEDNNCENVVGYNAKGDFVISALGDGDLNTPAFNQQEGTVVNLDNRLLPTNKALSFEGATLNDLANALAISANKTIDYTVSLPEEKGFKPVAFSDLESACAVDGDDIRGYALNDITVKCGGYPEEVAELPEFNGAIIYHVNLVLQFNAFTAKTAQLENDNNLYGSASFAAAARLNDGDKVAFEIAGETVGRIFKLDDTLKGTVALNPTFDLGLNVTNDYRFEHVNFTRESI